MSSKAKQFWENCDTTFAHITPDRWLTNKEVFVSSFKEKLGPFNPNGKVILDYGIGAGHLGVYLLNNHSIEKYIGIDIAQRSLNAADENLSSHTNVELKLAPVDFSQFSVDLFTSFAVIQHFPSEQYLNEFLDNVNSSNALELALQIRHSKVNIFSSDYKTLEQARLGCRTSKEYMLTKLTKYECIKEHDIEQGTNYQYLYFTLKK